MVYLGPSKGCLTCKRRRKKCDETRPSCLRCLNSKRTCRGYENSAQDLSIHQYRRENPRQPVGKSGSMPQETIARKCSLPRREILPGMPSPQDACPKEVKIEMADECALAAFFYDYCITSPTNRTSPGFLRGLQEMFSFTVSESMLKRACKAVAYASHGIKLNRPYLLRRGMELYQVVLTQFSVAMHGFKPDEREEALYVAVLLGLYEVIVGNTLEPGYSNAHANGVSALLGIQHSPTHLLETARRGHPLLMKRGGQNPRKALFSIPGPTNPDWPLDDLLSSLGVLHKRAEAALSGFPISTGDILCQLRDEALALDNSFISWEEACSEKFCARTIFHIEEVQDTSRVPVGLWPGKVDTYSDHYIAGTWNLYRACRLSLLDLIVRLSDELNDGRSPDGEQVASDCLVRDMLASITYHLTEDIHLLSREIKTTDHLKNPGRSINGLLLMHSIFITSHLDIVDVHAQMYLKRCLEWIGKYMGIGQATMFSQASSIDFEYLASSCMIVLVGLLV